MASALVVGGAGRWSMIGLVSGRCGQWYVVGALVSVIGGMWLTPCKTNQQLDKNNDHPWRFREKVSKPGSLQQKVKIFKN